MDSAPAAARERPRTRARVRISHLAPAGLRVACDHALFEFLAPWMRNGCALYAANKEIQRSGVLYRRRRLSKLAALRREVLRLRDDNCFVNLSGSDFDLNRAARVRVGMDQWHKIIDVRGDTVILEKLFKSGSHPNRFPTLLVRLEQWRCSLRNGAVARPGDDGTDYLSSSHDGLRNCWNAGVYMYTHNANDAQDANLDY